MTMPTTRHKLKKWLDDREFYELCQAYRTAPLTDQAIVIESFEKIKRAILRQIKGPR
jgi:hypothetical protein